MKIFKQSQKKTLHEEDFEKFSQDEEKWLEMEGVTKEEKEEITQDEDLNSLGYLNALIKKLKVFDYFIEIIKHHILLYISQQTFPNSKTCQSPCHPKFSTFGGILLCAILPHGESFSNQKELLHML